MQMGVQLAIIALITKKQQSIQKLQPVQPYQFRNAAQIKKQLRNTAMAALQAIYAQNMKRAHAQSLPILFYAQKGYH